MKKLLILLFLLLPLQASAAGLFISSVATSTFPDGISILKGCFSVNTVCLTLGSFAGTLSIANGGTNNTTFPNNTILYFDGTKINSTSSSPLYVTRITATGTVASVLPNASTTNINVSGSTWLTGLTGPSGLAVTTDELVYAAATTTFSTGLTYLTGNVTCDTASASIFGCLTSASFSKFNSASTTFSNGLAYSAGVASLATIAGNSVLANITSGSAIPTALATSSLFAGTNGQILVRSGGTWTGGATTTFSTGLTYAAGNTTCDIASASVFGCLSSAFFSKFNSATTTFGNGITYSAGSAGLSAIAANSILANNTSGSAVPVALATSSFFSLTQATTIPYASSTSMTSSGGSWFATTAGSVGIGTTSPWGKLSVNPIAGDSQAFAIGSSSLALFGINTRGSITVFATTSATTTTLVLDWSKTGPQVEYKIGTAATTITLINATTSLYWGSTKRVLVCNPGGTAGALTWAGVEWAGGTTPTQTTTTNQCDLYSFFVNSATSTLATPAYKVFGAATTGFQ